jgi:hypothetical protein
MLDVEFVFNGILHDVLDHRNPTGLTIHLLIAAFTP